MRFEDISHDGKCDSCGKEGPVVCCTSRSAPATLAYCKTCHANGIEPYDILVDSVAAACDNYPEDCGEALQHIIRNNLIFRKKKEAEFVSDLFEAKKILEV